MTIYSKFFLLLSFGFILFNGSSVGFIIYHARLGELFGIVLFHFTSLFGALCASIANNQQDMSISYYPSLFFYTNIIIFPLPYYYLFIANHFIFF